MNRLWKNKALPVILAVLGLSIPVSGQDENGTSPTMILTLDSGKTADDQTLPGIKKPVIAGENLHFGYSPKGDLEGAQTIQGVAYVFRDYRWELTDVVMQKNGNLWDCTFKVPEDCAFIAFKFYTNTENGLVYDTNTDEGYMYTTITAGGQKTSGSDLAWGTFRHKNFNGMFSGYFNDFTISDQAAEFWIKKEIKDHPENLPRFIDTYIQLAQLIKPDDFLQLGDKLLGMFLRDYKNLNEEQYEKVKSLYRFQLKDDSTADSLEKVITTRFPKGRTMRLKAYQNANALENADDKREAMEQFLLDFPFGQTVPDEQQYLYNKTYLYLFQDYFVAEAFDKIRDLIPSMNFAALNDSYHFTIAKAYYFKNFPTYTLETLSEKVLAAMLEKVEDLSYVNGLYWSPAQATANAVNQLDRKLKVHVRMLFELEKYTGVVTYMAKISPEARYANSEINRIHVEALSKLHKDVLPVLEAAARQNALTPELTQELKTAYTSKGHTEKDFEAYLSQLKAKGDTESQISEKLVHISVPEIVVETPEGKRLNIKGGKDEIIILDFWATWCAPCKKSFPAMQSLVRDYKTDSKVSFYFVNTLETNQKYKESAEAYMKKKELSDLKVVYDIWQEARHTNKYTFSGFARIFNSSGIPRKVVLKNGYIRYTSEGYSGNPGELTDELHTVIKLLKEE